MSKDLESFVLTDNTFQSSENFKGKPCCYQKLWLGFSVLSFPLEKVSNKK
jgi:hypothetical protein